MNRTKTLLSIIVILIICFGVTFYIFSTEPEAETEGATKQSAMLIDVIKAEQGDFRPIVKATGTVQPSKDINLSARVSGEVLRISSSFNPGSFVREGELLVQLDPADYQNALTLRRSDLENAQAQLDLEQGRQEAAKNDFKMAESEMALENKSLLLREPQLKTAQANVKAAEASLKQAELNLQRATIRAPFDAHVVTRNVNKGSQVGLGNVLGRLVGTDEYWVTLNVPTSKINWLDIPSEGESAEANVTLRNSSWTASQYRVGKLYRMIGALTNQTRFAQVLVTVDDPLSKANEQFPPLIIGSFLEAEVPARELKNVVRLNRDYLRKDQTVWVMDDDSKLDVREVDVAFQDEKYAYILSGLSGDDKVISTSLSTVVEGAALRTEIEEGE